MQKRSAEAVAVWQEDKGSHSKFAHAAHLLCHENDVEGLRDFLDDDATKAHPLWDTYRAGLDLSEGVVWDEANAVLSPNYDPDIMPKHMRGLDTFKKIWAMSHDAVSINIETIKPISAKVEHICVVSCDSVFFDLYFNTFFESFASTRNSKDGLNVHIVNPTPKVLSKIENITQKYVGFTIETTSCATPAYYACARFWAAQFVMEQYDAATIIIIDFDSGFLASMNEMFRNAPRVIAGRRVASPKLPWQIWMASFTLLPPINESLAYLEDFKRYAVPLLRDTSLEHWYIDQNVLAALMTKRGYTIRNEWGNSGRLYAQSDKYDHIKLALR